MDKKGIKFLLGATTSIEYQKDDSNNQFIGTVRKNGVVVEVKRYTEEEFTRLHTRGQGDFIKRLLASKGETANG